MAELQTKQSRAWLLNFGSDLKAAVGAHEMSQVMLAASTYEVPCSPVYCSEVVIVQEQILPVLDVLSLFENQKIIHSRQDIIGIAVYQDDPAHTLKYAGLHLAEMPENIFVDDDAFCEMPTALKHWQPFAISCFNWEERVVPILDLNTLFSDKYNQLQMVDL